MPSAHYEQALRIKPDYAEAHNNLGIALAQTGKIEEAIAHYEQALRIKPDYAEAHNNLGIALAQTGKSRSHRTLRAGATDQARFRRGARQPGDRLGAGGQDTEAIGQYEQALRIKPDYVEAHYNLALALEKMGRTPEAIEHYQQALKLRPDDIPARNALTRLGAGQ